MTANRRIALNVVATYARSAYALALGLVTARWLLLSLGQVDYGLFGVVGGLVAFVTYFNRLLAGAVSRFYALSIGKGKRKGGGQEGLDECRRWFSAAVSVHAVVPLLLVAIGYPVGALAVRHWLVMPAERIGDCLWVWRLACLSAFVGMANVPFRAMYTAKQEIAELTLLNFLNATLNAVLLGYMVTHPGDWLVRYAFWHCLLAILPRLFVLVRAIAVYPECRLRRDCLWNWPDIRRLATFAGWRAFGAMGKILQTKGMMILVNLRFGPVQNAAVAVATRLASRTNTFAQSLVTSFSPAIVSAYGAGDFERMSGLVRRISKLGATMVAVVSIPLLLEIHAVMRIWLKRPPSDSPFLCSCVLVAMFLDKVSAGESIAIGATGRVAAYEMGVGVSNVLAIAAAAVLFRAGVGLPAVGLALLGVALFNVLQRVYHADVLAGVSCGSWFWRVAFPVASASAAAAAAAAVPRLMMPASAGRIALTALTCEAVLLPLAWFVVIDAEERAYLKEKFARMRGWLAGGGK